jgi:hypothetical protein
MPEPLLPLAPRPWTQAAAGSFSVDSLERQAARGHDVFTSMAAGSDVIFLDTSRGWLARQDYTLEDAHGKSPPPTPVRSE